MSEETPKVTVKYNKDEHKIEVFRKVGNNLVGTDLTKQVVEAAFEYVFVENNIGDSEELKVTRNL
tara:strand:+ start:136 stop:330 length:195 start_codon:yes stop_codon:yes gene_type:complete